MSVINTNITSMIGQSNLSKSQNALQTSMERLSSGLRINSAKDDAAGQAIANRMTSQINGLAQAQRNANDGISIAQTAEGGLNQINDNLQRIRELTVQAQNGTNSASDIDSIQQEVNQRLEEINRIAEETDFNGTRVLDVNETTDTRIQVGSQDNQVIDIRINAQGNWNLSLNSEIATDDMAEVGGESRSVAALGFDVRSAVSAEVEVDASDLAVLFDGAPTSTGQSFADIDALYDGNSQLVEFELDNGDTAYALTNSDPGEGVQGTAYAVTFDAEGNPSIGAALEGSRLSLALNDSTAVTASDAEVEVTGGLSNALSTLDDALAAVDEQRSQLGAVQNRFEDAIANLSTNETNLAAARSRIEDADYAMEVADMTRAQILQQAGTSVLAQANQIPQNVLSLLG
ncbi:FliC/FljB family flagellin [Halomonas mongoliensis]|uniref:Flagellin n=1 Tax=Halomonas mongoliensis TaxID=321265 RepID=A0ABU1GP93_9GAMM|nr:FliC/FljB family flagellin [Halomonas mongoliensis]MDR5893337.1 FliC/FljB family flagellin [Halomonas mongoliensis]